ncbi:hypothetical protein [Geofilum rhodophaeum]|uniref:hypothetical protein n=1 Tax=Geofilum rhodophaeum TaxID=1965019 RepID=UPI000B51FA8E|nr:hypothetical protein [Geofilum rhodophaeum]
MLYRLFNSNRLLSVILVLLTATALWLRLFLGEVVFFSHLDNPSMPMWDFFTGMWSGRNIFTAAFTTLVLALLSGLVLNQLALRFSLLGKQSPIVLLAFLLLSSGFLSVQKLNPVWLFVFFLVLALRVLFAGVQRRNPALVCFDAGFLLGLGGLFYAKGLFFFPFLLIAAGILRQASFRGFVAMLLGVLLPFILTGGWYVFHDEGRWFYDLLIENLMANPGQYKHALFSRIYLLVVVLGIALAMLVSARRTAQQKIVVRRYYRVLFWLLLLCTGAVLSPFFSVELLPIAALSAAVLVVNALDLFRKAVWQELTFLLLVLLSVAAQLLAL